MPPRDEKDRSLISTPLENLESPFLSEELFEQETETVAESHLEVLQRESPFAGGLDSDSFRAAGESPSIEGFPEDSLSPSSFEEQYDLDKFPVRDEQAFTLADEEEKNEQWSDVEYDVPTGNSSRTPDPLLAVPAFTSAKRRSIGKLLTPAESADAMRWNADNHPRKSQISPGDILGALQIYVDLSAVTAAITSYNSRNPRAPIKSGTKPIDAVYVEAIHQFQIQCYKHFKEHDGKAGPSVLDSLGFWPRKGLLSSAQTNQWAKRRIISRRNEIEKALSASTDLTRDLAQNTWWSAFVNPCFLGWRFNRPIHVYFARKLRKAELWLLSRHRFAGKTPAELSSLLDIDGKHIGGRSISGSKSIHTLGLGIDIKYLGNPHVGDYRDKPTGAKFFSEVMKRAAAKISGLTLTEEKFPQYLNKLGTDTSKTTGQIYDELVQRDQDLRRYLPLPEAKDDLAMLRDDPPSVFKGTQQRDPIKGFLNLDRDLVIALRDHACLIWGAVDLGAGASGDIMHFDCRLDDIGRAIFCGTGGTFNDKHPCWKSSEPPCPRVPERTRRAPRRAGEVIDSECEDDYVAEDDYVDELDETSEEQAVEYLSEEGDGFTDEFAEIEERDESPDYSSETWQRAGEMFEAEVPPLLKNPASSDPPGQTLYVKIELGRDRRCVKWREENKKKECVEYKNFVIRPMTGIFIPENYFSQPAVDLILYLHGHKTRIPGSDAPIADYWDGKKHSVFALREEINASRRNVILVAPTLGLKSEAGDLVRANGLDNYLGKVLEALRSYGPFKNQTPNIGNLILAAHSGSGVYMRRLATSGNRAASKVTECWGFDSLYNSGDVEPWRLWAKSDPQRRRLFSYYHDTLPTKNSERLEKDSRGRIEKLPNIFPVASQQKDHFKLVRFYLRKRLQDTPFLKSTAERQGPEQLFDDGDDGTYLSDQEYDLSGDEFEGEEESDGDQEELEEETPWIIDVSLMHDDLRTRIGEEEIIGLDGGVNLNIQLSASDVDAATRTHVSLEVVIRTPGKPTEKIVTRVLKVPKKGADPNNSNNVLYQLSVPTNDVNKILSPLDRVKEVATVRRIDGTSDSGLIRELGAGWRLRGRAEQADKCGIPSGKFSDEQPDALKLFQAGGVAMLEVRDPSNTVRVKRFIRNPADVFYYTGHGLGVGFSRDNNITPPRNCLAIEERTHDYCCWAGPSDIIPFWKSPMDLDFLIVAGCSVLAIDSSTGSVSGDGLEWARLVKFNGGPLKALLGYGDYDENENHEHGRGPMGSTAPKDVTAGDPIASELGKWIQAHPNLNGIIRKWLTINMSHINFMGIGIDSDGFCWRTRRKNTPGWQLEAKLITKGRVRYVIEKLKIR